MMTGLPLRSAVMALIVFNTESCTIFALEAETGQQLWSYWLGDPLTSTPTIAQGRVFTSYRHRRGGQNAQQRPANPDSPCGAGETGCGQGGTALLTRRGGLRPEVPARSSGSGGSTAT